MKYELRNQKTVEIRVPTLDDAEAIVELIKQADTETLFLAREPGEFVTSVEREKEVITGVINDSDQQWFVAEYEGKVVGQCSIGLIRRVVRYRHRAEVAFVILQDYCDLGIGGKIMQECIRWAKENGVTQLELDVVAKNERAIKMYEGFHFEKVGVMPKALRYSNGEFVDEYNMVLTL